MSVTTIGRSGSREVWGTGVWVYGIIFSAMFLLYAFANLGLAILDANYQNIAAPLIYGAYGVIHLLINHAYKTDSPWGLMGLLALYGIWTLWSLVSVFIGDSDSLSLATSMVVAGASAVIVTILWRTRNR